MPVEEEADVAEARAVRRQPCVVRPGALTALLVLLAAGAVVAAVLSLSQTPSALVSRAHGHRDKGVVQTVVSGSGNLEPANQLDVDFGTSGQITKIYAKEGDHVSKGELLARIDDAARRSPSRRPRRTSSTRRTR